MQITKIISGGQTGADQAALDAAIDLEIPHGGWIPKDRLTEDGPLPDRYLLREMSSKSYPARTEQNIRDSDGTVIFSRGPLSGGSKLTAELALKYRKPWLQIDFGQMDAVQAATEIHGWVVSKGIRVLNVAGPRASKDPEIYSETYHAIRGLIMLDAMDVPAGTKVHELKLADVALRLPIWPRSVEHAVFILEHILPLRDRVSMAGMEEEDLTDLHASLGAWVRDNFGLWHGNYQLMKSAGARIGGFISNADDASTVILTALAERLHQTHRLRVVK